MGFLIVGLLGDVEWFRGRIGVIGSLYWGYWGSGLCYRDVNRLIIGGFFGYVYGVWVFWLVGEMVENKGFFE